MRLCLQANARIVSCTLSLSGGRFDGVETRLAAAARRYLPEMQAWQENFPGETPNWHDFFHPHMEIDNVHTNGDFVEVGGTQTPRLDGRKNAGWCKLTQRCGGQ